MFSLRYFLQYSDWSPCFGLCSLCFVYMVFKTKIEQLKMTVSLENIVGNISCEDDMVMTSPFCLDTITLQFFCYALYLLSEDCQKAWNFNYQNFLFSFLTYVIILLFPPIYMVIGHSFMNKNYPAKIYIYVCIYIYIYFFLNIKLYNYI